MKNIRFSFLLLLLTIVSLSSIHARQVGTWKSYFAYQNATIVAETPNLCFGVCAGSLLSYNPEDEEIITYSIDNGLSDVNIQFMAYDPQEKALILVYNGANIDIFKGQNEVYNLPFIKDKNVPPYLDKTIYNLEIIDDYAYISAVFGIVVVDIKRKEVKNTYFTGSNSFSVTIKDNYIYALTKDGVKRGSMLSNLAEKENWETINLSYPGDFSRGKKIFFLQDQMVIGQTNAVYYQNPDGSFSLLREDAFNAISQINDQVVLTGSNTIYFYDSANLNNYTSISKAAYDIVPSKRDNSYWLACGEEGIIRIEKAPNSSDYTTTVKDIKVDSPKRNLNFYMTCKNNKLYIVGGGRGADRINLAGTLMVLDLKTNQWFNLDENALSEKTGVLCKDLMSVAVDPRDPNHYFVSSWGEGVYEFLNNEFVKLHTYNNSTLETASSDSPGTYVRVDGLVYDRNNTLWMVQGAAQNGLQSMNAQGEWTSYYYPALVRSDPNRILITKNKGMWLNLWRHKVGLVVVSGENYYFSSSFTDQQGESLGATAYLCMEEDKNGIIWVGTDVGPITFSSAEGVNRGICNRLVLEDEENNGYYLMKGEKVNAIAVDGGNRKWIGTESSGVFVVDQSSPSGVVVTNYTKENSQLLSDKVISIAINDLTGEVFIGTDIGLCSFMSEATEGKADYSDVYAYPNPVYPSRNNQVIITGLIENSTVKITDIAGNLIKEGVSMGGQYLWNCSDRTGATVKAGIYLVLATTASGSEGVVTKIMIIN